MSIIWYGTSNTGIFMVAQNAVLVSIPWKTFGKHEY